MSEWQPIESAPKNTEILVYTPIDGVVSSSYQHGCWQKLTRVLMGGKENDPTHWMPLPPAPEET